MSSSPSRPMKIGDFLLRRLKEAGVRHLFGVPGDYNLELLQQLQDTGALKWIGTCSELNASYAADGYARLNGLGAVLVTNGVGALSAINGVGGSYSEHIPVICIAGSIPLRSVERGLGMHDAMADGSYEHFLDACTHVTAAHARLTPRNAATEIDRLILTAWREKRPVYMELPSDIAYLDIVVPADPLTLADAPSDPERLRSCVAAIVVPVLRRQVASDPCGCGREQFDRRRIRTHGTGREDAGSNSSDQHSQIGDRRDVPVLSRPLHRQAKRTACARGDRDQRLPARHRLPAARGDHRRLLGLAACQHDLRPRPFSGHRR